VGRILEAVARKMGPGFLEALNSPTDKDLPSYDASSKKFSWRKVGPTLLEAVDTPAAGEVPSYNATAGKFEWVSAGGGGGGLRSATRIVAASDSLDKSRADYVCDGVDDQAEINSAIADLGTTGGMVLLLEGTYNITGSINLASNTALVGQGPGTVLRIPDGFNFDLYGIIAGSGASRVLVADLRIDGNKANQTEGDTIGMLIGYPNSSSYVEVRNCWVENTTLHSIVIFLSNDCFVEGNILQGNNDTGILIMSSSRCIIARNLCEGNIFCGISIESSNHNTISGNVCWGNGNTGIHVWNSNHNAISGNVCQESERGISIEEHSSYNIISGNTCQGNKYGIYIPSPNNTIAGNTCQGNDYHGIYVNSSSNNIIVGNSVLGNSQAADNTYDGICVDGISENNFISGNVVRHQGLTNQQRYGINVASPYCTGNLVHGNDLYQAGKTMDFNNAGTGTIYHNNRTSVGWVP
jgi:parallel beta-helix repeat protein